LPYGQQSPVLVQLPAQQNPLQIDPSKHGGCAVSVGGARVGWGTSVGGAEIVGSSVGRPE
jgi:hypothetical protein